MKITDVLSKDEIRGCYDVIIADTKTEIQSELNALGIEYSNLLISEGRIGFCAHGYGFFLARTLPGALRNEEEMRFGLDGVVAAEVYDISPDGFILMTAPRKSFLDMIQKDFPEIKRSHRKHFFTIREDAILGERQK